jgi:CRISPR/Cas system-associated exonuclease Cas4 (RecB family)
MTELVQNKRPDLNNVIVTDKPKELGLIPTWSHSALKTYETCAYRSYISKVKKVQEDFGPAAARGTEIHQQAEDYVNGQLGELPDTLKKFQSQFKYLREQFAEANVELEGEWGFTIDWEPCGWMAPEVWGRVKLDAIMHESETSARVIDYKTGKRFGNEISHSQQALTYAIGSFMRYPELELAKTELWYLDLGELSEQIYTRDQAMAFLPNLQERAIEMTTATKFPPNPSTYNCKWCSFKNGEYPICEWGLK